MTDRIVRVTIQGALLAAASNAIAQGFTVYRERSFNALDSLTFVQFILFSILNTPPNYMWQLWLEDNFPANPKKKQKKKKVKSDDAKLDDEEEKKLSITNTIIKFLLDQSVGAIYNTTFFITVINLLKGATYTQTVEALSRVGFFPLHLLPVAFCILKQNN